MSLKFRKTVTRSRNSWEIRATIKNYVQRVQTCFEIHLNNLKQRHADIRLYVSFHFIMLHIHFYTKNMLYSSKIS